MPSCRAPFSKEATTLWRQDCQKFLNPQGRPRNPESFKGVHISDLTGSQAFSIGAEVGGRKGIPDIVGPEYQVLNSQGYRRLPLCLL